MPAHPAVTRFLTYLSVERNASEHTRRGYALDLAQFFATLRTRRPQEITPLEIRQFVVRLSTQRVGRRTIARKLSCLRSFFRFLCREGALEHNPASAIPTPRLEKRLPSFLDEQQILRLLEAPTSKAWQGLRDRAFLETLYSTGMRVSELVGLNLEDVDEISGTAIVRGKGKKERLCPIGETALKRIRAYVAKRPKKLKVLSFLTLRVASAWKSSSWCSDGARKRTRDRSMPKRSIGFMPRASCATAL